MRPDWLFAVSGPQARAQLRTVQQIVDFAPVPTFDDPARQMVEQLPDVLQFFDALIPDPDQVIEVPKILPENVPLPPVLRDTQLVEQLVEVPTIFSHASLAFLQVMQRTAEQIVDIPVPRVVLEVFKVYPVDRVQQRFRSRSPILMEVFKIFSQSRVPAASSSGSPGQAGEGVLRTFPTGKKCEDPAHPGVGIGCGVERMDAVSLAGVWQNMGCGVSSLLLRGKSGALWSAPLVYPLTQWLGAAAGAGCARVLRSVSQRKLLEEFPVLRAVCRVVRTWKSGLRFCPRIFQSFWCMCVACGVRRIRDACAAWLDSGYMFYGRLWANFTFLCVAVNSNPEAFALHSCRMEKRAQLMLLVAASLSAACTLKPGHYFYEFSICWQLRRFSAAECSWSPR